MKSLILQKAHLSSLPRPVLNVGMGTCNWTSNPGGGGKGRFEPDRGRCGVFSAKQREREANTSMALLEVNLLLNFDWWLFLVLLNVLENYSKYISLFQICG